MANSAGFNDAQPNRMFQDVPLGSTFQVFIGRLASRGYISGYPCGGAGEPCVPPGNLPYFRPNANATRGQIIQDQTPTPTAFNDHAIGSAIPGRSGGQHLLHLHLPAGEPRHHGRLSMRRGRRAV